MDATERILHPIHDLIFSTANNKYLHFDEVIEIYLIERALLGSLRNPISVLSNRH